MTMTVDRRYAVKCQNCDLDIVAYTAASAEHVAAEHINYEADTGYPNYEHNIRIVEFTHVGRGS